MLRSEFDDWAESDDLDDSDVHTPEADDDLSGLDVLMEYQDNHAAGVVDTIYTVSADPSQEDEAPSPSGDVEPQLPLVHATNASAVVTVAAYLNGSVAWVELDPHVVSMAEHELAEEICKVADVAAKKASAESFVSTVDMLVDHGMSPKEARSYVETNMSFSTPEEANVVERALMYGDADRY